MNNKIKITRIEKSKIQDVDFNNFSFGSVFTDHMFECDFIDGKWPSVCASCEYMERNGLDSDVSTFEQFTGDFKPNLITGSDDFKKPKNPPTNLAVTGIYFLTPYIFEIIKTNSLIIKELSLF